MITAQDIREKTFEKSTFGGYAMNEVDDFLDELANDIAASQKEAGVLRGKMKVLVDEIQKYRSSEDEIHKALVSAQRTARTTVEEAQAEADKLLSEAREKAEALVAAARTEADDILADARAKEAEITGNLPTLRQAEERRLDLAQKSAAEFIQNSSKKLAETLKYLRALQDADLTGVIVTPAPDERKAIAAPAEEGPETEESAEPEEAPAEEAPAEEAPAEEAPAEEKPDYFKEFEDAVYQTSSGLDKAEAEDGDDSAPLFQF